MAKLFMRMQRGFCIAVFEDVSEKPFAVYLEDCLIKSNLTLEEAEQYIHRTIKKLDENKRENWKNGKH